MTRALSPKDSAHLASKRALSIPEILERIFSYLPDKARDRVGTLVCKSWHAILCCQHHENHHRYPRQLVQIIFCKRDWQTHRHSFGYTHDNVTAIGSTRGGLFDVRFGCWTDQVSPPKFEYPDIPPQPRANRKNQAFLKTSRDVLAYPVKPCILQSSLWPTRLPPNMWQYHNEWGYFSFRDRIPGLARVAPDPTSEKASWLDYLDGLGALQMILTGRNNTLADFYPIPTFKAAERWQARKDLLEALRILSGSASSQITPHVGYKPRERFALLELEILYLDLTYPPLQVEEGQSAVPDVLFGPVNPKEEYVATGDDYEMFLRPLTSIPGVSCHLRKLVLKHLMVWPGIAQSSDMRRKGRRTQRQKKGEGLKDDEGLFPIGPILKTCRQLEELTLESDDPCVKEGRKMNWRPSDWERIMITLVLFIDGACDEDDGGEMKEPVLVDVSELGDDPDQPTYPCEPLQTLSGLKLKKLRLKEIHVPEAVLQSLIQASPSLSDLWIQAPVTEFPPGTSLSSLNLMEDERPPRHDFGPNVTCDRMEFFRDLGARWPQLTKLHFSKSEHRYTAAQMRTILKAFPNSSQWTIGWRELGGGVLEDLNRIVARSSLNRTLVDMEESQGSSNGGQSFYRTPGLYGNFLTSLDIVPIRDWSPQCGDVIHVFLCEAWHLEYLRAGSIGCYLDNLDLNNVLQTSTTVLSAESINDERGPQSYSRQRRETGLYEFSPKAVWACRNLKVLHIEFTRRRTAKQDKYRPSYRQVSMASSQSGATVDGPMVQVGPERWNAQHHGASLGCHKEESVDPEKASRVVFGYLARFCPRLCEVTLECSLLSLSLEGGFTILTRIKTLKRISIFHLRTGFEKRDVLPWVIKRFASSGSSRQENIMGDPAVAIRLWTYRREIRRLRRNSENEQRAIVGTGDLAEINKDENSDRNGGGFSNTEGAQWVCTVSKDCYRNLGYLQDLVLTLSDLIEKDHPKTGRLSKVTPSFGVNDGETWPDLVRLQLVYMETHLHKPFLVPLLRKYRPEMDIVWDKYRT
ncbi:hypothetical protein EMPS_01660 [Entomortierella parvispora]|uniref:F-box domain-containing protein n=1 Tax=Entomortierella parvispora TaxID=205924 RepID=A0A9P3H3A6_9FUNG|nr:hypothetical protein EMPS_01660 [Entomortierella parvispora]